MERDNAYCGQLYAANACVAVTLRRKGGRKMENGATSKDGKEHGPATLHEKGECTKGMTWRQYYLGSNEF